MAGERDPRGSAADPGDLRDIAMRGEPDRYIAATLAPREARADLMAIAAFAAELGRIPSLVSDPTLGLMRLQWWADALTAAVNGGGRPGHPVGDAMARVLGADPRRLALARGMIEAREFDLSGGLPSDDAGVWAYLDAIEGNPFRLALMSLGAADEAAHAFVRVAGRAYGLARSLGRLPMLLHNGGLPLPADRLKAAGVDPSALTATPREAKVVDGVARVVADLRASARSLHGEAATLLVRRPRSVRTGLLPLAMVEPYFRVQRPGEELVQMAEVGPLTRVARLGLAYLTGRL